MAEHGWLETSFSAVLLAVPAPQVAPLLKQLEPGLVALADRAVMRGSWALMLRFAAPVNLAFNAAFVNQGPLLWIARNSSKPGRNGEETWLLHARPEWSEAHLEDDPERVAAALLYAFGQLGAPAPHDWTAHCWRYAGTEKPPRSRLMRAAPGVQRLAWGFAETGSTAAKSRVPGSAVGRWPNLCCGRSRHADGLAPIGSPAADRDEFMLLPEACPAAGKEAYSNRTSGRAPRMCCLKQPDCLAVGQIPEIGQRQQLRQGQLAPALAQAAGRRRQ